MIEVGGEDDWARFWRGRQPDDYVSKVIALEIQAVLGADFFNFTADCVFMKWRGGLAHQSGGKSGKLR
jgi:hypothetical protein